MKQWACIGASGELYGLWATWQIRYLQVWDLGQVTLSQLENSVVTGTILLPATAQGENRPYVLSASKASDETPWCLLRALQ